MLLTLLAPVVVELALKFGPAEYFSLMVFAFTTVSAVLGASTVRGLTSLFIGLFLGLIGIDSQTGQPRFAFGVAELLDGVDVVVLAVGLFAVGEALYVAAYQSRLAETIEKLQGLDHDVDGGLEALLAGLAARHRDRFSLRHDSGRRRRDPDLPLLYGGEEALEASRGVRPWRDRGRRRARSGEQRLGHRRRWCRC